MKDYIVRAAAANAQIRAFAASTTELVEEARSRHNTSPVATAALGRLLTGGVMMGSMMKNATDVLTLQIQCQGRCTADIGRLTISGHIHWWKCGNFWKRQECVFWRHTMHLRKRNRLIRASGFM